MRVLLIMPVYNEARSLERTLDTIARQTYDRSSLRIAIVDGASSDGCAQLAERWLARNGFPGCVIVNPKRSIPSSLNCGLRLAQPDEMVARLDAHTLYGPTYIADAVRALETAPEDVVCVGGPQAPAPADRFEHAVGAALLTHPLGIGRTGTSLTSPQIVDNVYLGVWRPGVLQRAGGFDEHWRANEDSELLTRLRGAGFRILKIPTQNQYEVNRGILATVRQWAGYGFWRSQTLRRHPTAVRLRHIAPSLALLVAFALLFGPWRWLDLAGFVVYAIAIVALRGPSVSLRVALACAFVFPLLQIAFTLNMLRGLFRRPVPFAPYVSPIPSLERDDRGERSEPVRRSGAPER